MDITSPLFLAILANGPVKVDGYTYFLYGGKVRKCKSTRGPRKSRTEGEKQTTDRFTEARKMWKIYKRAIGDLLIWRIAARERGVSKSDSLFHSTNGGCLFPGKGVWAFKTFRFSMGTLEAPVHHRHGTQRVDGHFELGNGIDCRKQVRQTKYSWAISTTRYDVLPVYFVTYPLAGATKV